MVHCSPSGDLSVKNINLRLVAIIRELHKSGSVSKTAEHLGRSQAAISMGLAKLRRHFNDPLFVQTSRGMRPTPHASEILQLLARAEEMLQTAMSRHVVFDARTSKRTFHLLSTDVAQVALLPKLLGRLKATAPSVQIDVGILSDDAPRLLASGKADVAIGSIHSMGAGFCQQGLFEETFVGAARRNHPRVRNRLTLHQFRKETHLAIACPDTIAAFLEKELETNGIRQKIGLTVPSYFDISPIVTATDYLVILPQTLASHLSAAGRLQVLKLPFPLPACVIGQHWHERHSGDPAIRWLTGLIAGLFPQPLRAAQLPAASRTSHS